MVPALAQWTRPAIAAACAALALAAGLASADQQTEVRMRNNLYLPDALTVPVGTTVRFVNEDGDIHTVSQVGGGFESGLMFARDAWTYTFDTPGTYEYFCLPHPLMVATITVQ